MTGSTPNAEASTSVIAEGAYHHPLTRQIAGRIVGELALRPDHSRVESGMKLARRHGASSTKAINARYLLMGARLVYESGRHYYKAAVPRNGTGR